VCRAHPVSIPPHKMNVVGLHQECHAAGWRGVQLATLGPRDQCHPDDALSGCGLDAQ